MEPTAAEYFAAMIGSYDSLIRRAVPHYEEMTRRLVEYLPAGAADVLELGCGTGNFSIALAARYPSARVTFVDAGPEMVELTRRRVAEGAPAVAERARFEVGRFEDLAPEAGPYDLVASSISLHHVRDKAALFRTLHRALRAGGQLCFADQMRAEPAAVQQQNWDAWLAFCRAPGHCSEEEIESLLAHAAAHDHYETAARHLRALERAGFRELDCVWRNGMWGIIAAAA